MIRITTQCCARSVTVTDGSPDVHLVADALGCTCCPQAHHHGRSANETGVVCRPVTITLLPGSVQLTPEG